MNNVDVSGMMKREELKQLVQPLLRSRATVPLEQALFEAKIKSGNGHQKRPPKMAIKSDHHFFQILLFQLLPFQFSSSKFFFLPACLPTLPNSCHGRVRGRGFGVIDDHISLDQATNEGMIDA